MAKQGQNNAESKNEVINDLLGGDASYNEFYHSVSVIFRIISFVMFAAFLLFVISSAFAGAENFSYENFEYIIRNFELKLDENRDSSRFSIKYNPDSGRNYALFGEGLAVCGSTQMLVYSPTGRLTCSEPLSFSEPIMTASDKFALVYETGSGKYKIFNAFTEVLSAELPYSIKGAVISDSGAYALITSSDSYNSVVEVYDSNFSKVNSINRTGYITCIDISDSDVLVASVSLEGTDSYTTSLLRCGIGSDTADFEYVLDSSLPLSCTLNDRGYAVVYEDQIEFYNDDRTSRGKYIFADKKLHNFKTDENGALLLFKNLGFNTEYHAVSLSSAGNVIHEKSVDSTVFDIEYAYGVSYLLTENEIVYFDGKAEHSYKLDVSYTDADILSYAENSMYICTNTAALILDLSKDKSGD